MGHPEEPLEMKLKMDPDLPDPAPRLVQKWVILGPLFEQVWPDQRGISPQNGPRGGQNGSPKVVKTPILGGWAGRDLQIRVLTPFWTTGSQGVLPWVPYWLPQSLQGGHIWLNS